MGNMMSDLVEWLTRIMIHDIQAEIVIYGTLITLSIIFSYLFAGYFMNISGEINFGGHDIDEQIEKMKNHSKALKMMEAAYYNLNFKRSYRTTSEAILMQTILILEEHMKRNVNFRLKLNELTYPLVKAVTGLANIPDELELGDAVTLVSLMKQKLEQDCYDCYLKGLQGRQSIYPDFLGKRIEEIKPMLKKFEFLVIVQLVLDDKDSTKNMVNMLRRGKIKLVENEVRQLEHVMKKKSEEYFDSLPK